MAGEPARVAGVTRLTAVGSQGEADVICSMLRAHGIECSDRGADLSVERGGFGGWREILVNEDDLEAARELLAATPPEKA